MLRILRDQPLVLIAASLLVAFGGAYAMFQWAIRAPGPALVGRPGTHTAAGSDQRPAPHPAEPAADCLDCHVPFRGTPPTRCLAPGCHGSLATGTPPREGPAMPIRFHAALRAHDCGSCHQEHAALNNRRLVFSHDPIPSKIRTRCPVCHPGQGIENHAQTDAIPCDLCHGTERWSGPNMTHGRVAEQTCDLCHRAPDNARHASVAGNCQDCHDTHRFADAQPAEK